MKNPTLINQDHNIFMQIEEIPFQEKGEMISLPSINEDLIKLLPTYQSSFQLPFKIYKPIKKFKKEEFQLKVCEEQIIIDQILETYLQVLKKNKPLYENSQFLDMIRNNSAVISKGCDQANPPCCFIAHLAYCIKIQPFCSQKFSKGIIYQHNKDYPLSLLFIGIYKNRSQQIGWEKYFKKAIEYCFPLAFVYYGNALIGKDRLKPAYEMLKNGQYFGFEGMAYLGLAKIFYFGGGQVPKNEIISMRYFEKSLALGTNLDLQNLQIYGHLRSYFEINKEKASNIKSTLFTEGRNIAMYIDCQRLYQKNKNGYPYEMGSTNNFTRHESLGVCLQKKVFHVVMSPMIHFPSRMFLAEDIDGHIEKIAIYNWRQIPKSKLALLHTLGTQVILNQYVRKIGSNDLVPMYRVDNPTSVQIKQTKLKKRIPEKKLRDCAKQLFKGADYQSCLTLYQFLLMRKCEEPEVVFSNIGLTYEKMDKIDSAISSYRQSLVHKKFYKSEFRLANCLMKKGKLEEAEKIAHQMNNSKQKDQILLKIREQSQNKQKASILIGPNRISKMFQKTIHLTPYKQFQRILFSKLNIDEIKNHLFSHHSFICDLLKLPKNIRSDSSLYMKKLREIFSFAHSSKQEIKKTTSLNHIKEFLQFFYSFKKIFSHDPDLSFNIKQHIILLEKKIEEVCLAYVESNQIEKAIELSKTGVQYSPCLTIKYAQFLIAKGSLCSISEVIQKTIKFMAGQSITFVELFYLSCLHLQALKAQRKLKQIKIFDSTEFLTFYQNKTKRQMYEYKDGDNFESFYRQQLVDVFYDIQEYSRLHRRTILRIKSQNILACFSTQKYQKARQIINNKGMLLGDEKEIYKYPEEYKLQILQIMLLEKQKKRKKGLLLCQKLLEQIPKRIHKQFESQIGILTKIILKQKLKLLQAQKDVKVTIKACQQALILNSKNYGFVFQYLKNYILSRFNHSKEILKAIQNSYQLSDLFQDLYEDARDYFLSKNPNEFPEVIQEYFALQQLPLTQHFEEYMEQEEILEEFRFEQDDHTVEAAIDKADSYFEGEVCRIKDNYGGLYLVVFEQTMNIPEELLKKFIIAASKLNPSKTRKNGIKFMKNGSLRLKINAGERLCGKLIVENNLKICYFNELQKHDAYKRKKH